MVYGIWYMEGIKFVEFLKIKKIEITNHKLNANGEFNLEIVKRLIIQL